MKVDLYELNNECEKMRTLVKLLQQSGSDGKFLFCLEVIDQLVQDIISTSLGIITGNYSDEKKKENAILIATHILRVSIEIDGMSGLKNEEFEKIKVSLDKLMKMTQ